MIPYDLIITASHRPHLFTPTIKSLLAQVDQPPARIRVHDDAAPAFKAKISSEPPALITGDLAELRAQTMDLLASIVPHDIPVFYTWADPPRKLGMALRFLLDNVQTEYALYSQDDFVTVRPLPIQRALATMDPHCLHQIRFNKRATLQYKDTWQGRWTKEEVRFERGTPFVGAPNLDLDVETLTVSDHWYFQTGLWRVAPIRAAIHWLTATSERRVILGQMLAEEAVNHVMNGRFGPISGLEVPYHEDAMEPYTRRQVQKTFIWGPIGSDRYIRHIGGANPTADYDRTGGVDDPATAWREIRSYNAES